jgi:hypothetical protein
MSEPRETFI